MRKQDLNEAVSAAKVETHDALQTVYDALNKGQRAKLIKDEHVKAIFDRYGVNTEAEA